LDFVIYYYIIIIGIQPLSRFGQRPEPSQETGMVLVRCILGKFLGVVCHCFSPLLDVPTFATRCLHVGHNARDPSGRRWNCGRECCPVIEKNCVAHEVWTQISGAFHKSRKAPTSFFKYVRPSLCPCVSALLPLDAFSWNLMLMTLIIIF